MKIKNSQRGAEAQTQIQKAVDSFVVPDHLRSARREYFKAGAASMALHISKSLRLCASVAKNK
jgi:hypothetical protein